jgi:calcium-dependent protein kinase
MAFASSSSSSSSAPSFHRGSSFVLSNTTGDINSQYSLGEQLGQPGQFGYALKAVNKTTKEVRAVKVISKCKFSRAADKKVHFDELRTEIDILRRMDHPNVIKLFDVFENETEMYLVTELCSGGELFDRIKARGQYNEKDAATTLRQIVSGLAYLHKNKIAHCDLKPDNFLFLAPSEDSLAKVIDFGMSKYVRRRQYFHSLRG